jgi:hypothetical protein
MSQEKINNIMKNIINKTMQIIKNEHKIINSNTSDIFKKELINQIEIEYNLTIDKLKENPKCNKTLQLKFYLESIIANILEVRGGHLMMHMTNENNDISCNKTINSSEIPTVVNAIKDAINTII